MQVLDKRKLYMVKGTEFAGGDELFGLHIA
jgi:hypothetical protein